MTADRRAALVEKVTKLLVGREGESMWDASCWKPGANLMNAQIELWLCRAEYEERAAAAIDLIRAEVLEEAARVADDYEGKGMDGGYDSHLGDAFRTRREIAAAIRSLKGDK